MINDELTRSLKSFSTKSNARSIKKNIVESKSTAVDNSTEQGEKKLYEAVISEHDQNHLDPDYLEYLESSSDDLIEEFVEVNREVLGGFFAKNVDDALHQCAIVLGHANFDELRCDWYERIGHSMFIISATESEQPSKFTVNACDQSDFKFRSSDWTHPWVTGLLVLTGYAQELELQAFYELKQSRKLLMDAQHIRAERVRVLKALLESTSRSCREISETIEGLVRQ